MTSRPSLPRYPVWPTVAILTALAGVGALVWGVGTFTLNASAVAASGPFGWIVYGPALVATYTTATLAGVVLLPLWTICGGHLFASMAGANGSAARDMRVTFFSDEHPIHRVTQRLAERMGLPPIRHVGWFPNEEINAFAMGNTQANALIAVSKGAVERLTKEELIAVIGHELGHVASNDMARMTQARGIQEALTFFLVFRGLKKFARWVFTPLSELEILRMSRAREFTADRISAIMLGPGPMISALQRLQEEKIKPAADGYDDVLMWSGLNVGGLLSTHPPIEQRIARLAEPIVQDS